MAEDNPDDEAHCIQVRSYAPGVNSKPIVFAEFTDITAQLGMYWLLINKEPGAHIPGGDQRSCI